MMKRCRRNGTWPVAKMFGGVYVSRRDKLALEEADAIGVVDFAFSAYSAQQRHEIDISTQLEMWFGQSSRNFKFKYLQYDDEYGVIYGPGVYTGQGDSGGWFEIKELPFNLLCRSLAFQIALPTFKARRLIIQPHRIRVSVSWGDRIDGMQSFLNNSASMPGGYQVYQDEIQRIE